MGHQLVRNARSGPSSELLHQNLCFRIISREFVYMLEFEKRYLQTSMAHCVSGHLHPLLSLEKSGGHMTWSGPQAASGRGYIFSGRELSSTSMGLILSPRPQWPALL